MDHHCIRIISVSLVAQDATLPPIQEHMKPHHQSLVTRCHTIKSLVASHHIT